MYEMPPKAKPSKIAYKGAVIGANFLLKIVIIAVIKPAIAPPIKSTGELIVYE